MPIAVAIDGAYFLKRFKHSFPDADATNATHVSSAVVGLAAFHVAVRLQSNPILQAIDGGLVDIQQFRGHGLSETPELYRIFFYDCAPIKKRVQFRVSGKPLDFAKSEVAVLRDQIHKRLCDVRKVALRLGTLNEGLSGWIPHADAVRRWLANPASFDPRDDDFVYDLKQKGVDMRLGLDVAAMSFKRQIDQLVLVAGDADFVPAVKLARREGVDVVLDPMWGNPAPELMKHVDGVRSCKLNLDSQELSE